MRLPLLVLAGALTFICGAEPFQFDLEKLIRSDNDGLYVHYLEQACLQDHFELFNYLATLKPLPLDSGNFKAFLGRLIGDDKDFFLKNLRKNTFIKKHEFDSVVNEIKREQLDLVIVASPKALQLEPKSIVAQLKEAYVARDWSLFQQATVFNALPLDDPEFRALLMEMQWNEDVDVLHWMLRNNINLGLDKLLKKVIAGKDVSILTGLKAEEDLVKNLTEAVSESDWIRIRYLVTVGPLPIESPVFLQFLMTLKREGKGFILYEFLRSTKTPGIEGLIMRALDGEDVTKPPTVVSRLARLYEKGNLQEMAKVAATSHLDVLDSEVQEFVRTIVDAEDKLALEFLLGPQRRQENHAFTQWAEGLFATNAKTSVSAVQKLESLWQKGDKDGIYQFSSKAKLNQEDPEVIALIRKMNKAGAHEAVYHIVCGQVEQGNMAFYALYNTERKSYKTPKMATEQVKKSERSPQYHPLKGLYLQHQIRAFTQACRDIKLNPGDPLVVELVSFMLAESQFKPGDAYWSILLETQSDLDNLPFIQLVECCLLGIEYFHIEDQSTAPQPSVVGEPKPVKDVVDENKPVKAQTPAKIEPVIPEFKDVAYPDFASAKVVATLAPGVKLWTSAAGGIRKYASLFEIPQQLHDQVFLVKSAVGLKFIIAALAGESSVLYPKFVDFSAWCIEIVKMNAGLNGVALEYDVKTHKALLRKLGKLSSDVATPLVLPLRQNSAKVADLIDDTVAFFTMDSDQVEITILPGDLIVWIPTQFMQRAGNKIVNLRGIVREYEVEDPQFRLETFATIHSYIPGLESLHAICFQ